MPRKNKNNPSNTNIKCKKDNNDEIANFKLLYKELPIENVETLHQDNDSGLYIVTFKKNKE